MQLTSARFRFYGTLNDFLTIPIKNRTFSHTVKGRPSVKDTLEALGIPHPEIDGIIVNGREKDFAYQLNDGDEIRIYPWRYSGKIQWRRHLIPKTPRPARFVCDSHLGKLVRHLRLLGFDSVYRTVFPDQEIIRIGVAENRIILTRDKGILKNKAVRHGYWLRSVHPPKRLKEVVTRFQLSSKIKPFTLCLECNGRIRRIAKNLVRDRLPPLVRQYYRQFYICDRCRKIYWKGSHHHKLMRVIHAAQKTHGLSSNTRRP